MVGSKASTGYRITKANDEVDRTIHSTRWNFRIPGEKTRQKATYKSRNQSVKGTNERTAILPGDEVHAISELDCQTAVTHEVLHRNSPDASRLYGYLDILHFVHVFRHTDPLMRTPTPGQFVRSPDARIRSLNRPDQNIGKKSHFSMFCTS